MAGTAPKYETTAKMAKDVGKDFADIFRGFRGLAKLGPHAIGLLGATALNFVEVPLAGILTAGAEAVNDLRGIKGDTEKIFHTTVGFLDNHIDNRLSATVTGIALAILAGIPAGYDEWVLNRLGDGGTLIAQAFTGIANSFQ